MTTEDTKTTAGRASALTPVVGHAGLHVFGTQGAFFVLALVPNIGAACTYTAQIGLALPLCGGAHFFKRHRSRFRARHGRPSFQFHWRV